MGASNMGAFLGLNGQRVPLGTGPTTGIEFHLGNVLEVGGQHEYRHLYRYLGSAFRVHVAVVVYA